MGQPTWKFVAVYAGMVMLLALAIFAYYLVLDYRSQRVITLSWEMPSNVIFTTRDGKPVMTVDDKEMEPVGYVIRWGLVDPSGTNETRIKSRHERRLFGVTNCTAKLRCRPGLYYTFCTSFNHKRVESDVQDILLFSVPDRAKVPVIKSIRLWSASNDPSVVINHESSTNGPLRVVSPADRWVQFADTNAEADATSPAPAAPPDRER